LEQGDHALYLLILQRRLAHSVQKKLKCCSPNKEEKFLSRKTREGPQSENELMKKDDKNPEALCVFPTQNFDEARLELIPTSL